MKNLCVLLLLLLVGCETKTQVPTDYTKTQVPTGYTTVYVGTTTHDGHKWVISSEGGVVHHPDCSCHKIGENR